MVKEWPDLSVLCGRVRLNDWTVLRIGGNGSLLYRGDVRYLEGWHICG